MWILNHDDMTAPTLIFGVKKGDKLLRDKEKAERAFPFYILVLSSIFKFCKQFFVELRRASMYV